ncbi:hypothetical protein DRN75_00045 [Nanoarchaeota archaeon]|nr:MAG: hypothetical protein DRN75_00045 [Nanoarchaeota archaeon]
MRGIAIQLDMILLLLVVLVWSLVTYTIYTAGNLDVLKLGYKVKATEQPIHQDELAEYGIINARYNFRYNCNDDLCRVYTLDAKNVGCYTGEPSDNQIPCYGIIYSDGVKTGVVAHDVP